MAYLSVTGIIKKYGENTALQDVSLNVKKGEFVCVLGPSGCGKSTLLRVLAGLENIENGNVVISGRDVTYEPPSKRNFGIVFQSYALFPNMTVHQNIAYGLINRKLNKSDIKTKVNEALALVGLNDHSQKYPSQISGGQQQRVALARAIVMEPECLLLDEPLSALDAKVRVKLRHEIKSLHKKLGITTIMVTHDQEEALSMADKIVVMNNAVIEQIGTPEEVYESPKTSFVADFIGTINFLNNANAIRPEHISLALHNENAIAGRVLSIEYRGAVYRLIASSCHGNIIVDVPSDDYKRMKMVNGMEIYLKFPDKSLIALEKAS